MNQIILIQSVWKGYIYRKKNIPNILQTIQIYLNDTEFKCCKKLEDGRINSCFDENTCIKILKQKYKNKIRIPNKRKWYDILIKNYDKGWIPCNIKSTKMNTNDNTGNLAMCVYSYTNYKMDILKQYNNGIMANILHNRIKNKQYNTSHREYYFIVINKNSNEIIVNGLKGLNKLTPNINNLPFQIKWNNNKIYNYKPIQIVVKQFVETIQYSKKSWKETFIHKMRELNIE